MKAAIFTHFFPPEACAAATRVQSLADALTAAGHEVTVVTGFASFPFGRIRAADRFKAYECARTGRLQVVRLFSVLMRVPGSRFIHWTTSALSAALYALLTREHYDIVIASMPPITLGIPALAAAWRHHAKLVADIRDVFPDIAIAMGEWRRDGLLARAAEWLVRRVYHRADLVVAVTPTAIEQIAARGVQRSKLLLARNAAQEAPQIARARRNGQPFTAIYAGNLGLATDVDVLLDAAAQLQHDGVRIEIAGGGALADAVRARVERERLTNVVIAGVLAREEALRHIAAADVALVPLRAGITESVPTKIYDALSVACPVIVAASGEAAAEGAALGAFCTPPGNASALANVLRGLAQIDRDTLAARGHAGRKALQQRSGRAAIMASLCARICAL